MAISCDDLQRNSILFLFILTILFFGCSGPLIIILLIVGNFYVRLICLTYTVFYISGILRKVTDNGGRTASQWVRNWALWKWLINYFPVDLVKTTELPPDRNYLVCIFPHGGV
ncbi:2-acylglycerol O-acyltransferase 3, partial [Pseudolycoriella hygida]